MPNLPTVRVLRRYVILLIINCLVMTEPCPSVLRRLALRRLGMDVGRMWIKSQTMFRGVKVFIGDGTSISHGCYFGSGPIAIGERCDISAGVRFMSIDHDAGGPERRAGRVRQRQITVGDGTWIGASVTVLGGVDIAEGCVIASGAVVTDDTEPHGLYAGVPAVRKRDLPVTA